MTYGISGLKKPILAFSGFVLISFSCLGEIPSRSIKFISVKELKKSLYVLTSDSLEGRATGEPGNEKAARFIESTMKNLGLEPFDNGGYRQNFTLWQTGWKDFYIKAGERKYEPITDFIYIGRVVQNNEIQKSLIDLGEVNDSTPIPENLKDKIVLIRMHDFDKTLKTTISLNKKGVWAILYYCPTDSSAYKNIVEEYRWQYHQSALSINRPDFDSIGSRVCFLKTSVAESILHEINSKTDTIEPHSTKIAVKLEKSTTPITACNIIGRLKGTDSIPKQIALTAHYDHIGRDANGQICRGADDNGSGTAALLELARTLTSLKEKPQNDILFIAFAAEELGLYGSHFFMASQKPSGYLANINIDMMARTDSVGKKNCVYIIGAEKTPWLNENNKRANNATVRLKLDYRYDDGSLMNRSDHYHFYRYNIPVIAFFSGFHPDYHTPRDTMNKIDFKLYRKRVQLIFANLWLMSYDLNCPAR